MVALRRTNAYVILGGLGPNDTTLLHNQSTVYNADSDTWENVEFFNGQIQDSMGGLDATNRVWFWGGVSNPAPRYHRTDTNYWGTFIIFDSTFQWSYLDTTLAQHNTTRLGGTSVVSLDNNIIYYIGGINSYRDPNLVPVLRIPYVLYPALMTDILAFNTINQSWTLINATGSNLPSVRVYHTTIYIPNSDIILLYGGATPIISPDKDERVMYNPTTPVDDYIYTLNTTSFVWTQITNLGPYEGAGARFGHSGIVIENVHYN
ncbi:hypothetical protein DFQ30_011166 [Apophysomyces sp. BC1015]|nr:hypothetical protein DFQ30_011166 [Apophysomyces sp. BC1015]